MSTKQLYEKTSGGMKEVSPLVALEDIYSRLSDTPLEALVTLYNHVKCEWKGSVAETRKTVPMFLRRSGLFITYNNGTKYITEFFSAGRDQINTEDWIKDSNWTLVPDEDYVSAGVKPGVGSIGYDQLNNQLKQLFREKVSVTNFPDDEDIASVDNMLKFKDREADAANFQHKGYVILRKNLRLVNGVVKNILTQDMINNPDTIYEIKYDFDLNKEIIKMQEGCTLKFEGGDISNGILVGDNTVINKRDVSCVLSGSFLDNVSLKEINNFFRKTSKCKFEIKQNFIGTDSELKTMLEYNIKHFGLNKGVFGITLMYDTNKSFQINSTDLSLIQLASDLLYAQKKADIHEIKFYINKTDWTFVGTSDTEVITNYANKVIEIVRYLNDVTDFNTVYISNEWKDFSVTFTDENRKIFVALVNSLKKMGKKVGCTYQGFANMIKAENAIYDMLDCPAFNFYPRVFFGANDEVNENMDFSATIKELFDSYIQQLHILGKKKRIIVSEIGITYQNRGLAHPASIYDGLPVKPEFSLQMYVYYKSLIKALSQINEDIEINLWYCENIELSKFDKILNELYYE